ncbi:MAG TPA: M43 family zinc metalloprotease [Phycisphaerae bacterium]|nr:M43 family zinc metalloprotease [Phycisphaerae bacterium]
MRSSSTSLIAFAVIAGIGLVGGENSALADDWCGTRVRPEDVPIVRDLMAMGVYDPPAEPLGALYVPLTFHVVRRSDATGGLDDARLVRALDDANLYFANSGIRFCWIGPTDYIDDDDFYYNIDTMDEINALRQTNVVPDTINIYFTENLAYEGGPLCGISSFTFSPVQGIVMANDCTATDDNHSTFPHEIGHYFDLFHTHETAFGPECPDCVDEECNCNVAGDLLCDTPADPTLGTHNVDDNCNYFGSETDPCAGSPYDPDARNLMSYSPKACRNHFSNQQNFRIQATLTRLRPELINGDCPGEGDWNIDGKLLANDGAPSDNFGYAVALDGDRALIGACADDDQWSNSGSAYVFQKIGGVWAQVAKLTASDAAPEAWFGVSVALSGDRVLVGADVDDDHGSAYIFENIGGVWTQTAKLTAGDGAPGDYFAWSVGLSADTALVGSVFDDDLGEDSGSAYVFEKTGAVWSDVAKLTAAEGEADDWFAYSVSVSGDTAVIGAPCDDHVFGSAYVFQRDEGGPDNWGQVAKLTASDGAESDCFGASVALSGDTALVGAIGDDDQGYSSGSAYIFENIGGMWTQTAKLTASDGADYDSLGYSVALSGERALVGAYHDDDNGDDSGSAYIFDKIGGVWIEVAKLTAADGAPYDEFSGWPRGVAISGETALVGAYRDDDNGTDSGSAYVFRDLNALRNPCPGDLDADWDTDHADLGILLSDWGCVGSAPGDCPGDLDGDFDTDHADLGILLADWGCTP